ncbi:MAG: hypothetical protein PHO55_15125 [Thiomonas arsenitoxydans]|nr:hypothetical protein [Thiomonas arsenitoxydans]
MGSYTTICDCGTVLAGVTKRRRYCSPTCRLRAFRKRQREQAAQRAPALTAPGPAAPRPPLAPAAQLAVSLLEMHAAASTLRTLYPRLQPPHAWRTEKFSDVVFDALAEYFPEALP